MCDILSAGWRGYCRFAILNKKLKSQTYHCLLYTSDAADEEDSVDLGGRRIIKKKRWYPLRPAERITVRSIFLKELLTSPLDGEDITCF